MDNHPALISAKDLPDYERMLNDYRAGRLTNPVVAPGGGGKRGPIRLAKVITAEIAANGSGEAKLQKSAWTDSVQDSIDITNDFPVALPVDTQLYVAEVQGSWRVIVPFVTCPETV